MVDRLLRFGPLALALVACVLLLVSEFLTLTAVQIITVERGAVTGGSNHAYALAVIAVAAAFMAWGATIGGSRPAAFALLVLAVAALLVIVLVDLPAVREEGLIGETYEQASAEPRAGFYVSTLGAVLLLLAAVATLLLRPHRAVPAGGDHRAAGPRPAQPEESRRPDEPAQSGRGERLGAGEAEDAPASARAED